MFDVSTLLNDKSWRAVNPTYAIFSEMVFNYAPEVIYCIFSVGRHAPHHDRDFTAIKNDRGLSQSRINPRFRQVNVLNRSGRSRCKQ
ncbi:MAG: hypothetical protein ACRDPO_31070 [Streptosporangiaceae bacterium]